MPPLPVRAFNEAKHDRTRSKTTYRSAWVARSFVGLGFLAPTPKTAAAVPSGRSAGLNPFDSIGDAQPKR